MITINNSLARSSYLMNGPITVRFYNKITTILNTAKRWELTQAIQKVKSFLLARCHQNSDKVTKTVTKNLNQVNKIFTKIVKVSSQVSTKKALYTWKPCYRLFRHIRIEFPNDIKKRLIVFRHVRRELSEPIKKEYSLADSANYLPFLLIFSRQVAITQAEKLVFSLAACFSISSMSSWGKRIFFFADLLLMLPVAIFDLCFYLLVCEHYTRKKVSEKDLTWEYTLKYSGYTPNMFIRLKKAIPRSAGTLSRDLTTILTGVIIMANRYDSAHLRAEQSKLFKFYDLSTAQVVQSIASNEPQARKQLGKQSLIFVARIRLFNGVGYV